MIKKTLILFIISVTICFSLENLYAEPNDYEYSTFAYGGKWSDNSFLEIIPGNTKFEDSYIGVLGISKKLSQINKHILMEGELNVARHWNLQKHFEFNGAINLRWTTFPWDNYLDTSLAYGLGPSYANKKPEIEKDSDGNASQYLIFMMAELTFSPPEQNDSPWEILIRIHHRSGIFGAINDGKSSNFIATGLRYRF